MKWLIRVVAVVVVIVGMAYALGSRLPETHTATGSRILAASPEQIWGVITDIGRFPEWRPGVDEVEIVSSRGGHTVWRERGSDGDMTFEVVEATPYFKLVTKIADEDLPYGGTWTYQIVQSPQGTRITITEEGEIGSPFFRLFFRYFMEEDGTLRRYLNALEDRLGHSAP